MAPTGGFNLSPLRERSPQISSELASTRRSPPTRAALSVEGGFLEAWAQGYMVGSLIILILIVFCNYRSGHLLHKLILLELVLAIWHGTFIFVEDPAYGWYLSSTATLLFISYFVHNIIAWLKIRPFLPRWGSRLFIISLICVQPYWVAEAWSNFEYFNSLGSEANVRTRPWEALVRDPWWIFTTIRLVAAIKTTYGFKLWTLVRINSRFGIMLLCMALSIVFLLTDAAVTAAKITANSGINPYWRFALVFKCASDTIFLDDFKSVLDSIVARKYSSGGGTNNRGSITYSPHRKHSGSTSRNDEFIECSALESSRHQPVHASISLGESSTRSKCLSPRAWRSRNSIAKIDVQKGTPSASSGATVRQDSWYRDATTVALPAHVVHADATSAVYDSDRSLFEGRIV